MMIDYTACPPEHLLDALENAGRTPERALLQACLDRQDELTPGLLKMLQEGVEQGDDEGWDDDDPRWYRDIHAGLLLLAFREEKALPIFIEAFGDEMRENLLEWVDTSFQHYGPPAVEPLIALLRDRKAFSWGRIRAAGWLADIARLHPETRARVVEALRARLPRLDEEGRFVIPPAYDEDQVELWTFVAFDLAELKDTASQPQVLALYDAELIDEMVMGGADDYLEMFSEDRRLPKPFDLLAFYHPPPRVARVPAPEAPADDGERAASALPGYGSAVTFVRAEQKVGRNDPCPCGSGKKYKRCCGKP